MSNSAGKPKRVPPAPPKTPSSSDSPQNRKKSAPVLGDDSGIAKLWQRIGLAALAKYCERMEAGLRAGVDIRKVLDSESRVGNRRHQKAMTDMIVQIEEGGTLAGAMKAQGSYFPPLLTQMISAGELGGGLDRVFGYMANYYRDLRVSRSNFIGAITLPAIQLVLALFIISGVILIQGLLARNEGEESYDALGLGLKGWDGFIKFWLLALFVISLITVICIGLWQNWFNSHRKFFPILKNIPVIGNMLVSIALARMAMTLSLMLNAGVDARRAVRNAFSATGNHFYMSRTQEALDCVEHGMSLAKTFDAPKVLPGEFIEALDIGELSGNETNSLERLATEYQERARSALKQFAVMAGVAIWMMVAAFIIYFIFRMVFQYIGMLNSFME